jgi:hypothetical protein
MNAVSAAMATLLQHLYAATLQVERIYVDRWLEHDLTLPGLGPDDVTVRGGWPWWEEKTRSLRFHCMSITLPHPYDESPNGPSEIYVYLDLEPHETGFTVTAGIDAYLEVPVHRLPAGPHPLLRLIEEETTVDGTVAAIARCQNALIAFDDVFDHIGFPRRR